MAVTFAKSASALKKAKPRPSAKKPAMTVYEDGRYWIANLAFVLNVSRQTIYVKMKEGSYPKPDGHDGRRPYWMTSTVRSYMEKSGYSGNLDKSGSGC